ncbi:MAG TPA: hypothetical protein VNN55_00815 [bacterium]|nr:hypothetical protein [bacterium]
MRPTYLFKPDIADRLASDWLLLWPPLREAFIRFSAACVHELGAPPLVITCIARTDAENARLGGHPASLHLARPCRAIDIRRRGFDRYAASMKSLWQSRGEGWDFVIEGPPYNRRAPHFHLEAGDQRPRRHRGYDFTPPQRTNSTGTSTMFKNVDVNSPPKITCPIGL